MGLLPAATEAKEKSHGRIRPQEAERGASHADLSFEDKETFPAGMPCALAGLGLASGLRPFSHSLATANQSLSYGLGRVSRQNSEKPSNICTGDRGLEVGMSSPRSRVSPHRSELGLQAFLSPLQERRGNGSGERSTRFGRPRAALLKL